MQYACQSYKHALLALQVHEGYESRIAKGVAVRAQLTCMGSSVSKASVCYASVHTGLA